MRTIRTPKNHPGTEFTGKFCQSILGRIKMNSSIKRNKKTSSTCVSTCLYLLQDVAGGTEAFQVFVNHFSGNVTDLLVGETLDGVNLADTEGTADVSKRRDPTEEGDCDQTEHKRRLILPERSHPRRKDLQSPSQTSCQGNQAGGLE